MAAPRAVSSRSQLISVWPGGTSWSGSAGAARLRSKAHVAATSSVRSTAPGQRANRFRCSAALRRCANGAAGSQPSISSSERRARTGGGAVEGAPGGSGAVVEERARDRALAASGEREPRVVARARPGAGEVDGGAGRIGEGAEVEAGAAPPPPPPWGPPPPP